jgi:hypothetical protein
MQDGYTHRQEHWSLRRCIWFIFMNEIAMFYSADIHDQGRVRQPRREALFAATARR